VAPQAQTLAERAESLVTRGDALRELGQHAEAVKAYEASAAAFRRIKDEVGWARTRVGITMSVRYTGGHSRVLAELDRARRVLTEHELFVLLARLEKNTGVLLSALGRIDEALAAHKRGLAAAERVDPRDEMLEAEILFDLSVAYYQVDDHERAELFLQHATAIFERQGQLEYVARARQNFARYAAARGHYSKALAAVLPGRRALKAMGRTNAAAHAGQVGVDCLIRLNRPDEAAELAEQVATEFESTGSRVEAALTRTLRSQALAQLGRSELALAELERAEQLYGSAEWESGRANVRLGRAVVLGEMGQWSRALEEAEAARDELRRRDQVARAAQAELVRGRAFRELGRPDAAADAAHAALDAVRDRPLPWLSYHAWRLLGEVARDAGEPDAAVKAFLEAISSLEQVQGRILTEYRASFLADKAGVYEAAVDLLLRRCEVERAFEIVERAKSRALVDVLAGGLDIRVRARTPEQARMVDELTRLKREHESLVEGSATGPHVRQLEQRITGLLEELRLAGADDLERLSLLEGRVYSPQALLDDGTAVLEFYRVGHDLAVFVVDRHSIRAKRLEGAIQRLMRLEGPLRLNLNAAISEPERRHALEPNGRALLMRAYDVLLRPIADWLAAYQRLVVVPHGPLHQLPFGALHDGEAYLLERFDISEAPSASSLTFCLRPRGRHEQRALIGAHSADGALPGALEEATAVAALFPGAVLFESALTLDNFKQSAPEADLIHLAAHGVSRLDAPLFSYVRLADGHLTAPDCFDLELDCALVTLSACESGRGLIAPGDEQIGLPRAFLYAGARAVVHSMWRIDDRATQRLMTDFYGALRAGASRGGALRQAQLASLRSEGSHPFVWAGFVLLGDWRKETV
jgi:CHAT domain-containing protein